MDKSLKIWILLALSKSSKKEVDVTHLYYKEKPDFFDLGFDEFWQCLRDLEKQGHIQLNKKYLSPQYTITEEGKKELRKLKNSNSFEYEEMLRCFPELELKDRIKNIEKFIFGIVIFAFSFYILTTENVQTPFLKTVLPTSLLISFVIALYYFSNIMALVIEDFKINFLNKFYDFLDENKTWLGYGLVVLLTIVGIIILKIYLNTSNKEIIKAVVIECILLVLLKANKINNYVKGIKKKKEIKK